MNDICFLSCAFGDIRYLEHQTRLWKSIKQFYPNNPIIFWTDRFPPNTKPFELSLYGFKVHAVKYAKMLGHKKIVFLDPSCWLVDKLDYYFEIIPEYGVIAAQDDNLLANYCGDEAFSYFGLTREKSRELGQHLCGGSLYVFSFDLPLCNEIFDTWFKAEEDGMFGNGQQLSHRNDESVMSLSLYKHGSRPVEYNLARYNDVDNPIIKKQHFR